jgi:hypothetical protein
MNLLEPRIAPEFEECCVDERGVTAAKLGSTGMVRLIVCR